MKRISARELSVIAIYTALLIAAQFVLSFVPGVEIVTVMLAAFCAVYGVRDGAFVALCFSLLRCLLFGFMPNVVVLYLIYYPLFALCIGFVSKMRRHPTLWVIVVGVVFTSLFTLLDDLITPLMYGYTAQAWKVYFTASLPVMGVQLLCAAVTLGALYYPLRTLLLRLKGSAAH